MPTTVTWRGCRLLWRRPTGRWWRSWGSWPWWAWLGWRRSRSGSLSSATDFFPTGSQAWCYKQGQWHCFCNRLRNWCQQNIIVIILVMITGIRCSGDQRRVSVWLLRWLDQAVVSVWGHNNWTQLVWPGQGWDDTWWSVLQICILPAPSCPQNDLCSVLIICLSTQIAERQGTTNLYTACPRLVVGWSTSCQAKKHIIVPKGVSAVVLFRE